MLYYCAYTWHRDTTLEQVARHVVDRVDAGDLGPEMIRGYYGLVGGGAGFLILETDDPLQVDEALRPSMHLMSWDVRAIIPFDFEEDVATFRQLLAQGSTQDGLAGSYRRR